MQHSGSTLHNAQHKDRQHEPAVEDHDHDDCAGDAREAEGNVHRHVPEHDGEALVGEGEGPEAEIGGGVGDAIEAEFWMTRLAWSDRVGDRKRKGDVPMV